MVNVCLALVLLAQPVAPEAAPAADAVEDEGAASAAESEPTAEPAAEAEPELPTEASEQEAAAAQPTAPVEASPAVQQPVAASPAPVTAPAARSEPGPSLPEPSDSDPTHGHVLDATGYLLSARSIELGLFYMGYGITDWLNIGTHPLIWIGGPLLGGRMGNLSLKLGTPITRWINVGLEVNATWLRLDYQGSKSRGFVLPATLGVSVNATESQSYSLAGRYIAIHGANQTDVQSQEIEDGALARSFQLIGDGYWRLSDSFGLYARSYVQPWVQDLRVEATVRLDAQTTAELEGEASPSSGKTPWSVLGGMQFHWGVANLRVGVGYGRYFVPRISVPLFKSVFPDLDFYARF